MTQGERFIMGCLAWRFMRDTEGAKTWGLRWRTFREPEKMTTGLPARYQNQPADGYVVGRRKPTLRVCHLPLGHDGPHRPGPGYSEDNASATMGRSLRMFDTLRLRGRV